MSRHCIVWVLITNLPLKFNTLHVGPNSKFHLFALLKKIVLSYLYYKKGKNWTIFPGFHFEKFWDGGVVRWASPPPLVAACCSPTVSASPPTLLLLSCPVFKQRQRQWQRAILSLLRLKSSYPTKVYSGALPPFLITKYVQSCCCNIVSLWKGYEALKANESLLFWFLRRSSSHIV